MSDRWAAFAAAFALVVAALIVVPLRAATPAHADAPITYTYSIAVRGVVRSDLNEFASHAAATLADPRGWSLGGSIRFARVESGGDFILWLAEASTMSSFSSVCDSTYSCQAGPNVIINDDRWAGGSPPLNMGLDDYRHMVVNHEVGHWLGGPTSNARLKANPPSSCSSSPRAKSACKGASPTPGRGQRSCRFWPRAAAPP